MDPMTSSRIMMISTHGYVSATPELGKPDTGGQVVYVLELSKWLAKLGYQVDIYTRQFEQQPEIEMVPGEPVRIVRIPCGGPSFLPKEWLCEAIPEWIEHAANFVCKHNLKYAAINSHYWDAGLAGRALAKEFAIPHLHTPHSIGSWKRDNMPGPPGLTHTKPLVFQVLAPSNVDSSLQFGVSLRHYAYLSVALGGSMRSV